MIKTRQILKSVLFILVLSSCATMPSAPSVLVLPGKGKNFTQFRDDDRTCRQFARGQIATAQDEPDSKEEGQQYYDIGYMQCMYANGHLVPVSGTLMDSGREDWLAPPPPDLPAPQQ